MKTLVSNGFDSEMELADFININKIKQQDILSINVVANADGDPCTFYIFYYETIELTAKEKEEQTKRLQAISSNFR